MKAVNVPLCIAQRNEVTGVNPIGSPLLLGRKGNTDDHQIFFDDNSWLLIVGVRALFRDSLSIGSHIAFSAAARRPGSFAANGRALRVAKSILDRGQQIRFEGQSAAISSGEFLPHDLDLGVMRVENALNLLLLVI